MSHESGENREPAWKELASELAKEQNPARIVRLAQELNEVLERIQSASKNATQANERKV